MKRLYLILLAAFFAASGFAQIVLDAGNSYTYSQDFSAATAGNMATSGGPSSTKITSFTAYPGIVDGVNAYSAGSGVLKFGGASAVGGLTTDVIDAGGADSIRLTLNVAPWTTSTPTTRFPVFITVTYGSEVKTVEFAGLTHDFAVLLTDFVSKSVTFPANASATAISFTSTGPLTSYVSRYFLDEMSIVAFDAVSNPSATGLTVQIGGGTNTTANSVNIPWYYYYDNTFSQQIYTAAEIIAANDGVLPSDLNISQFAWKSFAVSTRKGIQVSIMHTELNTFPIGSTSASFIDPAAAQVVYTSAERTFAAGVWEEFEFDAPFEWDGTSNIVITVASDYLYNGPNIHAANFSQHSAATQARYAYEDYPTGTEDATYEATALPTVSSSNVSYVNDVQFLFPDAVLPDCPKPTDLTVPTGDITAYTADVTWTAGGSETEWVVEYKKSSETTWLTLTPNPTVTASALLTGLEATTAYNVRVKAVCSASDESSWSSTANFTTPCGVIAASWVEDFENVTNIPDCWTRVEGLVAFPMATPTTANTQWGYTNESGKGLAGKHIRVENYGTTRKAWVITPAIDLGVAANNYQLTFDLSLANYYGTNQPTAGTGTDDKFYVMISTDGGNNWLEPNATKWDNAGSANVYNNISVTGQEIAIPLTSYTGVIKVAFYAESTVSNADDYISIDNVKIANIPTCLKPTTLAASATEITWVGAADSYDVVISTTVLADPSTGAIVNTTANPYLYNAWIPNITNYVYVRANCGGDESEWVSTTYYFGYCIPNVQSVDMGGGITHVTFGSATVVDEAYASTYGDPAPHYRDYTAKVGSFYEGTASFTVAITQGYSGGYKSKIWVDWNNDLVFDPVTELLATSVDAASYTLTCAIPSSQPIGNYRMRIGSADAESYGGAAGIAPCYDGTYGSYQDYTLAIVAAPDCAPVSALAASATHNKANVTFSSLAGTTDWEYVYDETASATDPSTLTPTAISTAAFAIEGLDLATQYTVWVRTVCGGNTSTWVSANFTTLAVAPMTIPYTFDGSTTSEWTLWGDAANQWAIGSATGNPENSLYISNDGGTTYDYTFTTTSHALASVTVDFGDYAEYSFSFDWKCVGENLDNFDKLRVYIADVATPLPTTWSATSSTFAAGFTSIGNYHHDASVTDWQNASITLPASAYANTVKNIVFVWDNDNGWTSGLPAAVDNISIIGLDCGTPTSVAVSAETITTSSATVTWTAGGASEWTVEYKAASDEDWTPVEPNPTTATVVLSGLSSGTTYSVRVMTLCVGSESAWSNVVDFTTVCENITIIPWEEGFENILADNTLPACFSASNLGTVITTHTSTPTENAHGREPHSGDKFLAVRYSSNDSITSPVFTLDANNYNLSFWYKADADYTGQLLEVHGYTGSGEYLGVVGSPITALPAAYTRFDAFFPLTAGDYYFVIKVVQTYSTWYLNIDDIKLDFAPSCLSVTAITVPTTTTTTATINWNAGASEDAWNVIVSETPVTDFAAATSVQVTANTYNAGGLDAGTTYFVYVQANCSASDVSGWEVSTFTTQSCEEGDKVAYTIISKDAWGDGWNGARLLIKQNGVLVATVINENLNGTSGSGENEENTHTVWLCPCLPYTADWVSGGYDSEASFKVYDSSNALVYESTTLTAGQIYAGTTYCYAEPTVITGAATDPTETTVTLNKTVTEGSDALTGGGFRYRKLGDTGLWSRKQSTDYLSTSEDIIGLTPGTTYEYFAYVTIGSTVDGNLVTFSGDTLEFATEADTSTPVAITTVYPADAATGVNKLSDVYAVFDGAVTITDASLIQFGPLNAVFGTIGNELGSVVVSPAATGDTLRIVKLYPDMLENSTYKVIIPAGAVAGLVADTAWTFSTPRLAVAINPAMYFPAANAVDVAVDTEIRFRTSRVIDAYAKDWSLLSIVSDAGDVIAINNITNGMGAMASLFMIHHDNLQKGTRYTVTIPQAAIEALDDTYSWSFTTVAPVAPTVTTEDADGLAADAAVLHKTVEASEDEVILSEGFEYRVLDDENPTEWIESEDGILSGLEAETTYEFRAYAETAILGRTYGDILTFTTLESSGLHLINDNMVTIYPNPASHIANVEVQGLTGNANVVVTDLSGKAVAKYAMNAGDTMLKINVSNFVEGTYLVQITSDNIKSIKKLIVKK
jgi:hypothetical protein